MNRLSTDPHVTGLIKEDDVEYEEGVDWSSYEKGSEAYADLLLQLQARLPIDEYERMVKVIDQILAQEELIRSDIDTEDF
jgi:hypothetical protein